MDLYAWSVSEVSIWMQGCRHTPQWMSGPAHTFTEPLILLPSAKSRQKLLITEHVVPWFLIVVPCFDMAWRVWVCRREELVNHVALCSFGVRQQEA